MKVSQNKSDFNLLFVSGGSDTLCAQPEALQSARVVSAERRECLVCLFVAVKLLFVTFTVSLVVCYQQNR